VKIIYDRTEAIKEKQKQDIQMPKENRSIKIHNAIVFTIAAMIIAGGAYLFFVLFPDKIPEFSAIDCIFIFVMFALICFAVAAVCWEEEWHKDEWYSENVHYYLVTEGKKVLDHELKSRWLGYQLWVTFEDENHVVDRAILPRQLDAITKTDISETTVDLKNHIVYYPYKG
jgi:hypothetical protein